MKQLRATYLQRPDQAYWAEQVEILVESASGWLARAEGNDAEAIRRLRAGAALEDASEKHVAMENRVFPVREQLGYLLLNLGQPEAALAEFQVSLKATPNRLRGYYGAARAAEQAGLTGLAREYKDQLRVLTEGATGTRAGDRVRAGIHGGPVAEVPPAASGGPALCWKPHAGGLDKDAGGETP